MKTYNPRNCQSLFGYAEKVHMRSGAICEFCDAGKGDSITFDQWRQLSVEHLIGQSQGGYLRQIRAILRRHFPDLTSSRREELAQRIDEQNTRTACRFCDSMTSRNRNSRDMDEILAASADPEEAVAQAIMEIQDVFHKKRSDVIRKVEIVRAEFEKRVEPALLETRQRA